MSNSNPAMASQQNIVASGRNMVSAHVFEAAVKKTRMPMAIADPKLPDCPLIYVNPAFVELTGYTADEVIGRNCRFLQGQETDQATIARIRRAVSAHEAFDEEIYNYRKDGSGFWNALHVSPVFDADGEISYLFASQIDISAQKEAVRRQAQRMESMGALASGVAHEFNNLMTVVLGSVERAASQAINEQQALFLNRAEWASRRAGQLAKELLSLARRQATEEQIVDLNEVVRGFQDILRQIVDASVSIRLDLAPQPIRVRLNPEQLELVLLNLIRNACDAIADGHASRSNTEGHATTSSVEVDSSNPRSSKNSFGTENKRSEIMIATKVLSPAEAAAALNGKTGVELSVSDTGPGMTPEVKRRATELFFTTKKPGKGTGLGLFLALEFIDHSGGKLTIDSEAGQGTAVRLAFSQAER